MEDALVWQEGGTPRGGGHECYDVQQSPSMRTAIFVGGDLLSCHIMSCRQQFGH